MTRTTTCYDTVMSGYDCRTKCVFSFRRNTVSDEADNVPHTEDCSIYIQFRASRSKWSLGTTGGQ